MQYLTLALAIAGFIAPGIATPNQGVDLDTRASQYSWSVTKWNFCRGNSEYDYTFNVQGPKQGTTPGFKASCSGITQGGYKGCKVTSHQGEYIPTVSANVNIVGGTPRLFVRLEYTDSAGQVRPQHPSFW